MNETELIRDELNDVLGGDEPAVWEAESSR